VKNLNGNIYLVFKLLKSKTNKGNVGFSDEDGSKKCVELNGESLSTTTKNKKECFEDNFTPDTLSFYCD
jgi:hypothetical protein